MADPYVSIRDVTKRFGHQVVLSQINLEIEQGEFVCLLGPSGCGKTTLLRIIAGLAPCDIGQLWVAGQDMTTLPPAARNMGIVFQSYALFPHFTAYQNIAYPLNSRRLRRPEIERRVGEMLQLVGLAEHQIKYPAQLSGGQQQRVALARALVMSPAVLLLDEPLSALDAKVRLHLRREIRDMQQKLGITTLMVTHDQDEALSMADRIVVMNQGVIEQVGTPQDVYEHPATPFVADFVGTMSFFPAPMSPRQRLAAVRPEHIRLLASTEKTEFRAVIESSEYRGAYYRYGLLVPSLNARLTADVPAEQGHALNHTHADGQVVYLEIPSQHLLTYANPESN